MPATATADPTHSINADITSTTYHADVDAAIGGVHPSRRRRMCSDNNHQRTRPGSGLPAAAARRRPCFSHKYGR